MSEEVLIADKMHLDRFGENPLRILLTCLLTVLELLYSRRTRLLLPHIESAPYCMKSF